MNRKKWTHKGIALALSAALVTGIAPAPAVAKTSTESIIGAVIGGAVAANETNAQISNRLDGRHHL